MHPLHPHFNYVASYTLAANVVEILDFGIVQIQTAGLLQLSLGGLYPMQIPASGTHYTGLIPSLPENPTAVNRYATNIIALPGLYDYMRELLITHVESKSQLQLYALKLYQDFVVINAQLMHSFHNIIRKGFFDFHGFLVAIYIARPKIKHYQLYICSL